jgi:hypothetical protein
MREEMRAVREELSAVQAGQRELARLVSGMGAGVDSVGSGLGGMGSSVRVIQRQLDDRAGEQKRLAKLVSRLEAESGGQQTSPPDTVRKQKGLGRRMGGVTGRQLQFGSEMEEKEQEQGKEEKASVRQEEVEQWYGGGGEAQGVYEEMRAGVRDEREEREQPVRMSKREERREKQFKEEMRKIEERASKIEERREAEIARLGAERERDEGEERELRELGEKELSVWDDGREVREEVQLFGCASTAE